MQTLADLKQGEEARIIAFTNLDIGAKLLEMGCLPGETVRLNKQAPLGCPISINVSGYELSLRKGEAATVLIEFLN